MYCQIGGEEGIRRMLLTTLQNKGLVMKPNWGGMKRGRSRPPVNFGTGKRGRMPNSAMPMMTVDPIAQIRSVHRRPMLSSIAFNRNGKTKPVCKKKVVPSETQTLGTGWRTTNPRTLHRRR